MKNLNIRKICNKLDAISMMISFGRLYKMNKISIFSKKTHLNIQSFCDVYNQQNQMDVYCVTCYEYGESQNKVVKNAPKGLCCDNCRAGTVSTCDKLGGFFGGVKSWTNCTLCGHSGAGHYSPNNENERKKANQRLVAQRESEKGSYSSGGSGMSFGSHPGVM